jgi:hypothetical protein
LTTVANLPALPLTLAANLPPVSSQSNVLGKDVTVGVSDTGEKFAASINNTGGQFADGAP